MTEKVFDLKKRSYLYCLEIIKFVELLQKDYITQTLAKQLLRSATSIGANIIEAQGASTRKDFANFYTYALKTANESKFWLSLLKDSGKAPSKEITDLINETNELSKILASCILKLKNNF